MAGLLPCGLRGHLPGARQNHQCPRATPQKPPQLQGVSPCPLGASGGELQSRLQRQFGQMRRRHLQDAGQAAPQMKGQVGLRHCRCCGVLCGRSCRQPPLPKPHKEQAGQACLQSRGWCVCSADPNSTCVKTWRAGQHLGAVSSQQDEDRGVALQPWMSAIESSLLIGTLLIGNQKHRY
jgi:hypothetical protein